MRILITGASGLIGGALARALSQRGHEIIEAGRRAPGGVEVDFAHPPEIAWWIQYLHRVDVVINAVGIFEEKGPRTFAAVHTRTPVSLFNAAAQAGVPLVLQLSALGSDEHASTAFHQSKRAADDVLRQLPVRSVIVQPSLVYAPTGASATLFNQLALLPVLLVPSSPQPIQPVHLQDLVDAMVRLVEHPPDTPSTTVQAVGPEPLTLKEYLLRLRHALGATQRQWWAEIPMAWLMAGARWMAALLPHQHTVAALSMLARGNHADASAFTQLLGKAPRPVERFLTGPDRGVAREHAQMRTLLVLMKYAMAVVWIATGILSLGVYPVQESLRLLEEFGVSGNLALVALYAGALLDLAMGLAIFLLPDRWLGHLWRAQIAVVVGYTLLITVRMPHWWLHPFGPVLKNLPLLVGLGMLTAVSRKK